MLNDFVVLVIVAHVAAFSYVIYGVVSAQFKTEDKEVKDKWR